MDHLPMVSIVMPCRNESAFIAKCLDSLIANDYPKDRLEIVVVDGMSTDGTREIVKKYDKDFIKIIDNPALIKPTALNIGIKETRSDIVMRIDAHTVYEPNYISRLVEGLDRYKADNIGGIRETDLGDSLWAKAFGLAVSHPFANGNAHWRVGSSVVRKVDTVFCGCYRREVFERIGYFNEKLIRTQDREFNKRLTDNGGTIILDPSVKCTYFPRKKISEYLKWNFSGAYWLYYARRFTRVKMISWRNIIPPLFIIWNLGLLLVFFFFSRLTLFFALPILVYWLLALVFSIKVALENKSISLAPVMLFLFGITHYSYGMGNIAGLVWSYLQKRDISS